MNSRDLLFLIQEISLSMHLDPNLCLAIGAHESGFDSSKTRFEPKWTHFLDVHKYAKQLGITEETERLHQATSWGAMQIMGSVARELKYSQPLVSLIDPKLSIPLSCKKILLLMKKYSNPSDVIAAYNAGSPIRDKGIYINQQYVDDVLKRVARFKESH